MKALYLKQRSDCWGPWSSFNYGEISDLEILKLHYAKAGHTYELILAFDADSKIIEDTVKSYWIELNKQDNDYCLAVDNCVGGLVKLEDINFGEFDFVHCAEPILSAKIIKKFNKTLFCYLPSEYWSNPLVDHKEFDLCLDYTPNQMQLNYSAAKKIVKFPYVRCPKKIRSIFDCENKKEQIFFDYRAIMFYTTNNKKISPWTEKTTDTIKNIQKQTSLEVINNGKIAEKLFLVHYPPMIGDSIEYQNKLAKSKYYVSQSERLGQAFQQACATKCICIGSALNNDVLHPSCISKPWAGYQEILDIIHKAESNKNLQEEILEHQEKQVFKYYERPINFIKQEIINKRK